MSDFNINKFSEEVFNEFNFIKASKSELLPGKIMKENARSFSEKLFAGFIGLVDSVAEKTLEDEKKKRRLSENKEYSERFIKHPENRRIICQALDELRSIEIITEEKFVKRFTKSLCQKVLDKEIAVPFEKVLFASIAYNIFEIGFDNFCNNISDEN